MSNYLEFWHWWALALCFVVVEAIMPSGVFMAMALAGGFVGALFLYYPEMTWQAQLGGFAAFTMVLTYPLTTLYRKKLGSQHSAKHAAAKHMGQEIELTMPIRNGYGEIELDGMIWGLKGPELKKGEKVKVIGVDTDMLVVRPLQRPKDEREI